MLFSKWCKICVGTRILCDRLRDRLCVQDQTPERWNKEKYRYTYEEKMDIKYIWALLCKEELACILH